jgi:DDE superfamily endonuclease
MADILALLQCLDTSLSQTVMRQLSHILFAMLAMTGRVTMLGLSRWAGQGGSYRTVQRFFYTVIPWAQMFWLFFCQHGLDPDGVYILAGDECVVTKSGKMTYGLDRFFSSLYGKPVPGLAFFALSLVSVKERHSFPVRVEQVVRSEAEKAASQAKRAARQSQAPTQARKPGRPKGSRNKNRVDVTLTPELLRIQTMVQDQLHLIAGLVPLTYLALDGHFGNKYALHMVRQCNLHLISKLRADAALYLPYDGPYSGHGPHRKYGTRLDYRYIPDKYLKRTTVEKQIETHLYQIQALHKEFAQPLNVVIIVKVNRQTGAWAHVILFSSDLELAYDRLIDYYCLRFQIEFNFRDAKQYWGLEDFMNVHQTAVTNAANLSLFMVNFAYRLLRDFRPAEPDCSVLDLKAHFRGYKYVDEMLKLLPQKPEPLLIAHIFSQVACLGRIHAMQFDFGPS